jgi:hypothetical protein
MPEERGGLVEGMVSGRSNSSVPSQEGCCDRSCFARIPASAVCSTYLDPDETSPVMCSVNWCLPYISREYSVLVAPCTAAIRRAAQVGKALAIWSPSSESGVQVASPRGAEPRQRIET